MATEQPNYVFSSNQLTLLLSETIKLYVENREAHSLDTKHAAYETVVCVLQGLDAERELFDLGEIYPPLNQIYAGTVEERHMARTEKSDTPQSSEHIPESIQYLCATDPIMYSCIVMYLEGHVTYVQALEMAVVKLAEVQGKLQKWVNDLMLTSTTPVILP